MKKTPLSGKIPESGGWWFQSLPCRSGLNQDPVVFDGRNIYSPEEMRQSGFYYESIGR